MTTDRSREDLRRLFVMKKTELQSMLSRGAILEQSEVWYTPRATFVPINYRNPDILNLTFDEFLQWRETTGGAFGSRVAFTSVYHLPNLQKILVIYLESDEGKRVLSENTTLLFDLIKTAEYRTIVCISKNGISSEQMTKLRDQMGSHLTFQFFTDVELAFNRAEFALAPIEVRVHLPTQTEQFEQTEGLNKKQLPVMLVNDQIAKIYGAPVDSVVQSVICGSESNIQGYYRFVRATSEK